MPFRRRLQDERSGRRLVKKQDLHEIADFSEKSDDFLV
jgi:hypothetical protein